MAPRRVTECAQAKAEAAAGRREGESGGRKRRTRGGGQGPRGLSASADAPLGPELPRRQTGGESLPSKPCKRALCSPRPAKREKRPERRAAACARERACVTSKTLSAMARVTNRCDNKGWTSACERENKPADAGSSPSRSRIRNARRLHELSQRRVVARVLRACDKRWVRTSSLEVESVCARGKRDGRGGEGDAPPSGGTTRARPPC